MTFACPGLLGLDPVAPNRENRCRIPSQVRYDATLRTFVS